MISFIWLFLSFMCCIIYYLTKQLTQLKKDILQYKRERKEISELIKAVREQVILFESEITNR